MTKKSTLKKYLFDFLIILGFAIFVAITYINNFKPGIHIVEINFYDFMKEMLLIMPAMFVIIGLLDVWIPRESIQKHIGHESGIKGMLWVMVLAFVQAGPLYVAFPVAHLLWKKGCSSVNVFIYISAFTTAKIPMLAFEIGFLGWQFSLMRILVTIPVFLLIGTIMGKYFDRKKGVITQN
ncbi:MAG: permease [Bacteroidota bacterium]